MIYEFSCSKCKIGFDKHMTFAEYEKWHIKGEKKIKCPKCKSSLKVKRVFSKGVQIKFNGPGFFSTDHKKG